ncbi:hypothetical protein FRC01_006716, partial [Tulasnella sp. 417]
LVILRLYGESVPQSLKELIRVLAGAAAQLEELTLSDSTSKEDEEYQPSSLITFPRLKNINLDRLPNCHSAALVAAIYAPACSDIRVRDSDRRDPGPSEILDAAIWKPGNTQVAAFLGLDSGSESRALEIFIEVGWLAVAIYVDEQGAERTALQFRRSQHWRLVELIREFFLHHPSPLSISLDIAGRRVEQGPLDLIPWSGHLEALSLWYHDDSLRALEQLGQRTAAPSWSRIETIEDWVCPNLRSIMLRIPEEEDNRALHVAALRSLVQKRWSGADSGFAPANQPNSRIRPFALLLPCISYSLIKEKKGQSMKPPSQAAITKALGILLESVQEENGLNFTSSCTHPLDVIPFDKLGPNSDALRVAKSSLDKGADELILRIQLRRNMATPIYRIPAGVFEVIFEVILQMTTGRWGDNKSQNLLKLMGVCRHWFTTVLNCPRLWADMDSALSPKFARLVFERSRDLPILSLNWEVYDEDERDTRKEDTWWMVRQNSSRFKSMSFDVVRGGDLQSLLESPTTALESLTVKASITRSTREFTLSEGTPLKHLSLEGISFNLNSQRLSKLVILSLYRSAVPCSPKLIRLLGVAAAQLEQLTICHSNSTADDRPSSSITFPRLKNIKLEYNSYSYSTVLVATIYAPACSYIRIKDSRPSSSEILDAVIWQPGNTQVAAFLGLDGGPEPRVLIAQADSTISTFGTGRWSEQGHLELILWSGHLEALSLWHPDDCLRTLEQLGRRTAAPSWSGMETREDWVCPNLRSIMLRIPEEEDQRALHVTALRLLVQNRWSRGDSGLAPANQPTRFDIRCTTSMYEELQALEAEIREIVPCFMF